MLASVANPQLLRSSKSPACARSLHTSAPAGYICPCSLATADCRGAEEVLSVYTTNMLGPLLTTQAFLPLMNGGKKQVC